MNLSSVLYRPEVHKIFEATLQLTNSKGAQYFRFFECLMETLAAGQLTSNKQAQNFFIFQVAPGNLVVEQLANGK